MKNLWLAFFLGVFTFTTYAQERITPRAVEHGQTAASVQNRSAKRHLIKQKTLRKQQQSLKRMAMADGKITRNERKLLRKSANRHKRVLNGHPHRREQRAHN